jgi:GTP-binding protein
VGEEGKAVVFVSNKWDLVENSYKTKAKKWIDNQLKKGSDHYKHIKIIFCSAKSLLKIDDIMDEVFNSYENWNSRISTGVLNDWLHELKKVKNTPGKRGEYLKIRFITQVVN